MAHPKPLVMQAEDAPAYWQRGILWNVLLSGQATFGAFTLMDQTMPRGGGPPPHRHERMSEGFYVIDGEITYRLEGVEEPIVAQPGAALWIPPDTEHSFEVTSETARALNFYTPGGFDDHMPYIATPATERTLPPTGDEPYNDPARRQVDSDARAAYLERLRDLHEETMSAGPK